MFIENKHNVLTNLTPVLFFVLVYFTNKPVVVLSNLLINVICYPFLEFYKLALEFIGLIFIVLKVSFTFSTQKLVSE